jgi:CO dehydrogenase/acetyl-CoA synthase beta subunit
MELMRKTILNLRDFINSTPGNHIDLSAEKWPQGGANNIVLNEDMGLELGNPRDESLACILWSKDPKLINDGILTLVGPDFPESEGKRLPFGKVVLVGVDGFNEENSYDRYTELDLLRFDIDLRGFMLKAVSQHQREWCRVSRAALKLGFSSSHVASELIRLIRTKTYVRSVEVLFVTSTPEAVKALREIVQPAVRFVEAMNKMMDEIDFDCDQCEYEDVCDEADELRGMRKRAIRKSEETRGRSGDY